MGTLIPQTKVDVLPPGTYRVRLGAVVVEDGIYGTEVALPFVATGHDPQAAIASGRYGGRLAVVNSEFEGTSADLVDRGVARDRYRFYAVAGAPHIPDVLLSDPLGSGGTTPASWQPEFKYTKAFKSKLDDYLKAGYILQEDADAMRRRATLCPPGTFTETYRDHYGAFTAIVPCGG